MISVGEIIYRINEHPLLKSVRKSDIVRHIKTVVELVGAPALLTEKLIQLELKDYRVKLPEDFHSRISVRAVIENQKIVLQHNTDDFKKFNKELAIDENINYGDTVFTHHIVNNSYLYADFKEGTVELAYKAYEEDENGWPMLPKNESLVLAIEYYVRSRHFGILADMYPAKYAQAHARAEQQYTWYVRQATSSLLTLDPVEAEALGNRLVRMIPLKDEFFSNHKYSGQPERVNRRIW